MEYPPVFFKVVVAVGGDSGTLFVGSRDAVCRSEGTAAGDEGEDTKSTRISSHSDHAGDSYAQPWAEV